MDQKPKLLDGSGARCDTDQTLQPSYRKDLCGLDGTGEWRITGIFIFCCLLRFRSVGKQPHRSKYFRFFEKSTKSAYGLSFN